MKILMHQPMKKLKLWLVLFFVTACGSEPLLILTRLQKVSTLESLSAYHNATTKESRAEAQFSVAGFHYGLSSATTISLVSPSSISINGSEAGFIDARNGSDLLGIGSYYYLEDLTSNNPKNSNELTFAWTKKEW